MYSRKMCSNWIRPRMSARPCEWWVQNQGSLNEILSSMKPRIPVHMSSLVTGPAQCRKQEACYHDYFEKERCSLEAKMSRNFFPLAKAKTMLYSTTAYQMEQKTQVGLREMHFWHIPFDLDLVRTVSWVQRHWKLGMKKKEKIR